MSVRLADSFLRAPPEEALPSAVAVCNLELSIDGKNRILDLVEKNCLNFNLVLERFRAHFGKASVRIDHTRIGGHGHGPWRMI
jgi:hypothetical protein